MSKIVNDFSWMIGGPQGSGVDSSATLFARACTAAGLWIFGKREYHSNIMGEHSYFQIRVKGTQVRSTIDPVHLLATFEDSTARIHAHELVPGGALIYDPTVTHVENLNLHKGVTAIPIPYNDILRKLSDDTNQEFGKLVIMKNTMAVAVSLALLGLNAAFLKKGLEGIFSGRKAKLVPFNLQVAERTSAAVTAEQIANFPYRLEPISSTPKRLLMTGTTAVALGKLKAGCRFQTYYPITPASDESVYLEGKSEYGMAVVQCEDEISAILMSLGAAITGVRTSTSTSGPGFSLMAEGTGWAGMNEVPVVIVNYQRGGPATGLPTRHEQADLLFTIYAAHGEFPRIVLAPGDMEEYYQDAFYAFNYAERYQTPVIILADKNIANNTQSILPPDDSKFVIERGRLATPQELAASAADGGQFKRFAFADNGVSPRPLPGQKGGIYWMSGDEHDEYGHISENPQNRLKMHDKRMRKLLTAAKEIPVERQYRLYGDEKADITIITWGSPKGAILDALPVLSRKGIKANLLQIRMVWPFPREVVKRVLEHAQHTIIVEMNYTSQMATLIRSQTGIEMFHKILKWTGRPMSETEIVDAVTEVATKRSPKVVLQAGE